MTQLDMGIGEDRIHGDGELPSAFLGSALVDARTGRLALKLGSLFTVAMRTDRTIRPPQRFEIFAGRIVG